MTPLAASVRVAGPATRRSHDGRALAALRLGTSFLRRSVHDLSSCRPAGLSSTGPSGGDGRSSLRSAPHRFALWTCEEAVLCDMI